MNTIECYACGHRCKIREGRRGICQVRFNEGGELKVPWGYVAALQSDPIEKKPFFHDNPSSNALTFGMLGCDYHCTYCQNWLDFDPDTQLMEATHFGVRRLRERSKGQGHAWPFTFVAVLIKSDGAWRFYTIHWSMPVD